ncbi:glycosyltransferase family 4 protein [Ilumatobacter sp.]|uniref:glycosyltransferase family 4 protein n=1 Tax=Ilumatobacter sp. TaxID=1967498 RepID=UPI003C69A270
MSTKRHADPRRVMHLTTVDMSLELLLRAQLDAVAAADGDAVGVSATGPYVRGLEERGVRHVPLKSSTRGWNLLGDLRSARELWSILRDERPTVLHTHNPKPGLYGRVVGRLAGVPIVVNTVHGLYATPDDRWLRRLVVYSLEAFASRWSDAELVQNAEDIDTIRRFHLSSTKKVTHLGNGVDLTRFRPDVLSAPERIALRREWGVDDDTVVVGTVGRLVAEKGYPELFDAMTRLDQPARLVVVGGDDPEKSDALPRSVIESASAAGVVFLGHRDDVERVLGGFDIFVLASHREGQPRAAMEAAASGLPIVATDIRGCRQVVEVDVTGLLVGVADPASLADALGDLISDPDRREQMGTAALQKAHAEFDVRDVVARVMNCYADVAARKGVELVLDQSARTS